MTGKRVLVCGGRNFKDKGRVWLALDGIQPDSVCQGGATGADQLAKEWCLARRVKCHTFMPDWKMDGRAAGPLRNQKMLDSFKPDVVLAFPGGKGTDCMKRKAIKAGVPVVEFD